MQYICSSSPSCAPSSLVGPTMSCCAAADIYIHILYICMYISVCVCVCIYMYTHNIYIYIYACIHIQLYISG